MKCNAEESGRIKKKTMYVYSTLKISKKLSAHEQ